MNEWKYVVVYVVSGLLAVTTFIMIPLGINIPVWGFVGGVLMAYAIISSLQKRIGGDE
jgi:hypothetical protein